MNIGQLLLEISLKGIQLRTNGHELDVDYAQDTLEPLLLNELIAHKGELIELIKNNGDSWWCPSPRITPEMLPLVQLTTEEIERIVATIPGGAPAVQDIYPLAPLQEGILFHHMMSTEGDPYLTLSLLGFDSRTRVDAFLVALQAVIDRHDILRTAFLWEGLPEPVQVVLRQAPVMVEEVILKSSAGDIAEQLRDRFDPRRYRLDVRQAPLMRVVIAHDALKARWVMLLLFHHLVGDHTTLEVLEQEVYAHLLGQSDRLQTPLPYRNYVVQARTGVSREEHERFFTEMLGDVDEPTAPFGLTDVQGDGSGITEDSLILEERLCGRLRENARVLGVSVASLCHLAWGIVLARATGRDDVVFGTVLFGRMQGVEGSDRMPGIFINTLPVRLSINGDGVGESVRKTHALLAKLLRHEHAPLSLAQRCSAVAASAPLFNALLNYRYGNNAQVSAEALQIFEGIESLGGEERTNYPITLSVDDLGQGFVLTAQVQAQLEPGRICGFMHTALESLVEALESTPSTALRSLEIVSAAERHRLLVQWNATGAEYPRDKCVHELFEKQVCDLPEAIAVVYEDRELSYAELNIQANKLAHYLRRQGVGPDVLVAICVERSLEMVIGLLAVLKAGSAYVPLDPSYPPERVAYMLQDSSPVVVLTHDLVDESIRIQLASGLSSESALIDLVDDAWLWQDEPETNLDVSSIDLTPKHLAYVIYTSGSTGTPKGVMIEHRNTVNLIYWACSSFSAEELSRTLFSTSLNFDLAVYELFVPLSVGATTHIVQNALSIARSPKVTLINTVPSAISALIEDGGVPGTVGTINLAGEPLRRALVESLFAKTEVVKVCNLYGPSETTTYSTWVAMIREQGFVPHIGRPIANTRIYILDSHGQPVPIGVMGEMFIGGDGVARGYLNRPELTSERFIPDPFANVPGARMYKTGDLARWLPDGNIELLGRNDFQVKIRGFRIELGEIEARLSAHPGIRDAVVLAREEVPGDKRLVAYYTAVPTDEQEENNMGADILRSYLTESLPQHMVPAAYVQLPELPLTPNGKLDRRALPAPDDAAYATRGYQAPDGEIENALARIWAEMLDMERVGRHDNFFELGGNSLLAINLINRMHQEGLFADVRDVFASPSLAALAGVVGGASGIVEVPENLIPPACAEITPDMLPLVQLTPDEIERIVKAIPGGTPNVQDIYPLAPLQEGILFHHTMFREGDPYLTYSLTGFDSRARLDGFLAALQFVIDRHDILRTAVLWERLSEPVQVVLRQAPLIVEEVSLDPSAGDIAEQLRKQFDSRLYRLDVRQAPMMRILIAHDAPGARWVTLSLFHHLAMDHTTLELLQQEMLAYLSGRIELLPAPLAYRNFVAQARLGVSLEEHETFFSEMLGDVDESTAPFGLTDIQRDGSDIVEKRLFVDEQLSERLRENARVFGVSVSSLCHLAWALVLARITGRDDVVFGTVLFGRMQGAVGTDRIPGLFINTLPIRIGIHADGVGESVRKTHALLAELLRHEHAPLSLAQRCSAVAAPAPLFSALLNYRYTDRALLAGESVKISEGIEYLGGEERTNYPFTLSVDDLGQGFALTAQVQAPLEPGRICGFMHTALESLVDALERNPSAAVHNLEILSPAERLRLLVEWNATQAEYPRDKCIHELFEQQASERPDTIAVIHEDRELSYAELNIKANKLAYYLRSLGVGPDVRVAICAERSLQMVIALLAVLKSGGAYVPLDPAYPVDRLTYMLRDGAPVVVLTHGQIDESVRTYLSSGSTGESTVIDLDADAWCWEDAPESNPDLCSIGLTSKHLAYVMYTSGSTGMPKGVMVEHRGVVNLISWHCKSIDLNSGNRCSSVASFGFDASVLEVWPPLCVGAALVLPSPQLARNPEDLLEWWKNQNLDVSFLPTPIAEFAFSGGVTNPNLRILLIGGDRLRRLPAKPQSFSLIDNYGPTENTVVATVSRIDASTATLHIGRPIANTRIYILDNHGQPVPIGVVGEIYIGGDGVARGYLNSPELTAEKFLPDPFSDDSGARIYKTGDLARYLPDGNIELLGRNDFQVKIRGFRIELGEIEARLLAHPAIREAVVLAREDVPGEKQLVAYYTAVPKNDQDENDLGADALRAYLTESLPQHMVPVAYVQLSELPLTPNGKLDRNSLPAPDGAAYTDRGYEAPEGAIETTAARIWAETLHLERIGRHDNFFDLGGHSLLAAKVVSLLKQANIEISIVDLYQHPTIKQLSLYLQQDRPLAGMKGVVPVRTTGSQRPFFLLHDQSGEDMYFALFAEQIDHDIPIYGLTGVPLDEPQLVTMEGIAARFVSIIRTVQPEGPYRLAGWSMGGTVAYEVAAQLIGHDQSVGFLGLLDSIAPMSLRANWERQKKRSYSPQLILLESYIEDTLDEKQREILKELKETAEEVTFEELLRKCREAGMKNLLDDYDTPILKQYIIRQAAHIHASDNYVPQRISIPLHLFAAEEKLDSLRDHTRDDFLNGWDAVVPAKQIQRIQVPGSHYTLMDPPNIPFLGRALSTAISQTDDNQQSGLRLPEMNYRSLVTIQTGKTSTIPIFCIPGAGDNLVGFRELTGALGKEQTVHRMQPRGADGVLVPHCAVEAATTSYLNEINAIQPDGPVHLFGHSFGGWVALEIAHQLRAIDRTVASLTVVDSRVPGSKLVSEYTHIEVLKELIHLLEMKVERSLGIDDSKLEALDEIRQMELLLDRVVRVGLASRRSKAEVVGGMIRTLGAALRTTYRPQQIYTDSLLLVLVNDKEHNQQANRDQHHETVAGWKHWAPNLKYWLGPGNQITVLNQPHVQVLAKWWLENEDVVKPRLAQQRNQPSRYSDTFTTQP